VRFGRLGQADDSAAVVDYNQVRQSIVDPTMAPVTASMLAEQMGPAPDSSGTDLTTITVTGHPTPLWPLLIILGLVAYALFWSGGRRGGAAS
jgi:hypothetical protein